MDKVLDFFPLVRRLYSLMYTSLSLKKVCLQKPIRQMRMTYRIASPLAKDSQFLYMRLDKVAELQTFLQHETRHACLGTGFGHCRHVDTVKHLRPDEHNIETEGVQTGI